MNKETYPHISFSLGIFCLFILFSGNPSIRHEIREIFGIFWNLIDMWRVVIIPAIIGIFFGIIALLKESKRKGLAIIGILLNLFAPLAIRFLLWIL